MSSDEESLLSNQPINISVQRNPFRRRTLRNRNGLLENFSLERQNERNVNFDGIPQISQIFPNYYVFKIFLFFLEFGKFP